jgi:osmotically-inducible protein OsmY
VKSHGLHRIALVMAAVSLSAVLSACAPLVLGGAMVTGVVATDRRTAGIQLEDESIELKVAAAVRQALGERVHLNVTSFNRQVLLTGEARTEADKAQAERLARSQENVRLVVNDLAVMLPSTLTQRSRDTVITSRVKAAFLDAKDLQVNAIKVLTERGEVYLMGRVTQREARRATDIARGISGVAKVVRVFEDISEEELRRISQPTASPAPPASRP